MYHVTVKAKWLWKFLHNHESFITRLLRAHVVRNKVCQRYIGVSLELDIALFSSSSRSACSGGVGHCLDRPHPSLPLPLLLLCSLLPSYLLWKESNKGRVPSGEERCVCMFAYRLCPHWH